MLPKGFEDGFREIDGRRYHYVKGGAGDALVLLHGWPLTWYSWRKVLEPLSQKYTVIAPDLPGLGDSEGPSHGFEKSAIARDIQALVRALGITQINLVGHDMGAPVAYAYARQFPGEVRQLVMLDVPLSGFGLEEFGRRLHLWHFDFFQTKMLPEALLAGKERELIDSFYPHYNPAAITPEDVTEYARTYTKPGALQASLGYYRAFPQDEAWNKTSAKTKLDIPVLAIGGEFAGQAAPFASMVQLAHNVTGRIIRGCGHYLAEEKPDELLEELLAFLQ